MKLSDRTAAFFSMAAQTIKSGAKIVLQSRRSTVTSSARRQNHKTLIVMGNGPSLGANLRDDMDVLHEYPTLAVNFAANAPEFFEVKPEMYLLADPHFFNPAGDTNVEKLMANLASIDWPLTLYLPSRESVPGCLRAHPYITVERFNPVGVEGFGCFRRWAYDKGLGMPRPRNVLIPAIMTGISAGFTHIYILGADHSWMRTLDVNDANEVVSVQPHFYADSKEEQSRVTAVYRNVRLHEILLSFHVAFKAYHDIRDYADKKGVTIINATPGSMIDAFDRGRLPSTVSRND